MPAVGWLWPTGHDDDGHDDDGDDDGDHDDHDDADGDDAHNSHKVRRDLISPSAPR